MPLRRDEISKKVIGSQRGAFKTVFEEAQKILRGTFGMELVELPSRTATHDTAGGATGRDKPPQEKAGTQNGDEGAGDRQAVTGLKKKGAVYVLRLFPTFPAPSPVFQIDVCSDGPSATSQGSKTYILRSALDSVLIERTTSTNKRILEAEAAEAPDDVDGTDPGMRTYGCLIAWNSADQLSALGILHVILALILVSGKIISDSATPSPFLLRFSPFSHLSSIFYSYVTGLTSSYSGPSYAPSQAAPPSSSTTRAPRTFPTPHTDPRCISLSTPAPRLPRPYAHRCGWKRGRGYLAEARSWPWCHAAGWWRR